MSIDDNGLNPCCSCGVCTVACSLGAINMVYDENGFLIPKIDNSICSHCGICKKVCYKYLNLEDIAENSSASKRIFAAWSKDSKIVQSTSSGGVGYELLKYYQEKSYNVAGVKYNFEKQRCEHIIATNPKDLEQIKGSKYLQSYTAEAFKNFKKAGKFVVIGTPCQIYGLRKLVTLWNRNDDFIFIDFYCHGTPSNLLWKKYVDHIREKHKITKISLLSFRCKKNATWHKFSIRISDGINEYSSVYSNDLFFNYYLSNACLNKSCYNCLLRFGHISSDIRIADFWGEKYKDNQNGVSLVLINTELGGNVFENIRDKIHVECCNNEDLVQSQPVRQVMENKNNKEIMKYLHSDMSLETIYNKTLRGNIVIFIIGKIKKKIKQLILFTTNFR